jgi:hypothetical protein
VAQHWGPVILITFFKIAMLHVVFDGKKLYKTVLEKTFFFILWRFYIFLVLVSEKLSKGPRHFSLFCGVSIFFGSSVGKIVKRTKAFFFILWRF